MAGEFLTAEGGYAPSPPCGGVVSIDSIVGEAASRPLPWLNADGWRKHHVLE